MYVPHQQNLRLLRTALSCIRIVALLLLPFLSVATGKAQKRVAVPTASRRADLQIGVGFDDTQPDYTLDRWKGFTGYATLDVGSHFGVELIFHQANSSDGSQLYERTYEIGPRYVRHYGRFNPYARATYGRGVFNFPNNEANLAYNLFGAAGGIDVRVLRHINARAEFEGTRWIDFPQNGLQAKNVTIGVAYHF